MRLRVGNARRLAIAAVCMGAGALVLVLPIRDLHAQDRVSNAHAEGGSPASLGQNAVGPVDRSVPTDGDQLPRLQLAADHDRKNLDAFLAGIAELVRKSSEAERGIQRLERRLDGMEQAIKQLRAEIAALSSQQSQVPAVQQKPARGNESASNGDAPLSGDATLSGRVTALEAAMKSSIGVLDHHLQILKEDLDKLGKADAALAAQIASGLSAGRASTVDSTLPASDRYWTAQSHLAGLEVRFAQGVRYLDPAAAAAAIRSAADVMASQGGSFGLRVVGYADFDGATNRANLITSQKRADQVRRELVELGIPQNRIVAVGRATEARKVDSNAFANANRRVEFEPIRAIQSQ